MDTTHLMIAVTYHEDTGSTYVSSRVVKAGGEPTELTSLEEVWSERAEILWDDLDAANVRFRTLRAVEQFARAVPPFPI